MYAVIKTGGKQYKVSEGEILEIDKIEGKKDQKINFSDVLLVADGDKVEIGQPQVPEAKVTAKIIDQVQGEKIRVARFKSKVRYRKVRGFRAQLTKVKIEKIETSKPQETSDRPRKKSSKKNG